MMRLVLKNIKNKWFIALETVTKSKKPKSRQKKYGKTRAAAKKVCKVKNKQSCTKHQKYHDEIMKNMKCDIAL